jgi:hypothetical protein
MVVHLLAYDGNIAVGLQFVVCNSAERSNIPHSEVIHSLFCTC